MINEQTAPITRALLYCELTDAQEGITSLLHNMADNKEFGEVEFKIHMAHIYRHLNRAWHGRNAADEQWQADKLPDAWQNFPTREDSPFSL